MAAVGAALACSNAQATLPISAIDALATSAWVNGGGAQATVINLNTNPGKLIDGSGLADNGGSILTRRHWNSVGAEGMWHGGPLDGGLGGPTGAPDFGPPPVAEQALVFELPEGVEYLQNIYIWNHNQTAASSASGTGRGVDEFELLVSSDTVLGTAVFTSVGIFNLAEATGLGDAAISGDVAANGELAQEFAINANDVRFVRLEINSNHNNAVEDYVGLSEVQFSGVIPEPSALVLGLMSAVGLLARRW